MATIDSYYFRVCTKGAERRGMDIAALLRCVGLDPARLADPTWRGSVEAMARLVRAIWQLLDDEFMGYTLRPVKFGAFELMGQLAFDSESVFEALEKGTRFYNVVSSDIRTDLEVIDDEVRIAVTFNEASLDPDHYFVEFWLIIWHRFACWLAGETITLTAAAFNYAKPIGYFEEFKYLFPCRHRFKQPACEIRLDLRLLRGPVKRTKAELAQMSARAPFELMTIPASNHDLAPQVRMLLRHRDAFRPYRAAEIADLLGIETDTLRRRLRREGSSLTLIAEATRRDIAVRRLLASNSTVEEIADALGYAEARSFTRAFRGWTGFSPSQYRRRFRTR
ncbi:MAG: AraC family transcriptional regulator [Pseudomonadota bacterium]|nr:AraC family transcriptional regulator [Pseudomonadota bacterium]